MLINKQPAMPVEVGGIRYCALLRLIQTNGVKIIKLFYSISQGSPHINTVLFY